MAREEDKEVEFGQTAQSPFHLLAQGRLALPPPNKPSRTLRPLPTLGRSSPHHLRRSAGSDTNVMGRTLVRTSKSSQTHFLVDLSGNCSCGFVWNRERCAGRLSGLDFVVLVGWK